MVVDVSVAIAGGMVFGRHVVVSDTDIRQFGADAEFAVVSIGRMTLAHDVLAKARTIFDAENAADRADRGTDRSSYHCADWAGLAIALTSSAFCALNGALGLRDNRQCGEENG